MEGDKELHTPQININKLIEESRAQINELKKSLENSNIKNTNEQKTITEVAHKKLQALETVKKEATNEQLGEIGKLQDEFNIITSTKASIEVLRSHITTSQKPQNEPPYPKVSLGDEFTQSTAYINRVGPIKKVQDTIENGHISLRITQGLKFLGIKPS